MSDFKDFEECRKACDEFDFRRDIAMEQCWNAGYRLGRRRWFWGPAWFVSLQSWLNTQRQKLFPK